MHKKLNANKSIPFTDAQEAYIKDLTKKVDRLIRKDKDKAARLRNVETFLNNQTHKTMRFVKVDIDYLDEED